VSSQRHLADRPGSRPSARRRACTFRSSAPSCPTWSCPTSAPSSPGASSPHCSSSPAGSTHGQRAASPDNSWVAQIGGWGKFDGKGIVGPMITYLLPILIGYTGGKMVYETRGGVVGAIATMGVIAGTSIPMFMGAMVMGPLGGWSHEEDRLDLGRQDQARLRDARQQLLRRHLGHDPAPSSASSSWARSSSRPSPTPLGNGRRLPGHQRPPAADLDLHRAGQGPLPQQRDQPRRPHPARHQRGQGVRGSRSSSSSRPTRARAWACCWPTWSSARAWPRRRPPVPRSSTSSVASTRSTSPTSWPSRSSSSR
jgi:hypothetical protein